MTSRLVTAAELAQTQGPYECSPSHAEPNWLRLRRYVQTVPPTDEHAPTLESDDLETTYISLQ